MAEPAPIPSGPSDFHIWLCKMQPEPHPCVLVVHLGAADQMVGFPITSNPDLAPAAERIRIDPATDGVDFETSGMRASKGACYICPGRAIVLHNPDDLVMWRGYLSEAYQEELQRVLQLIGKRILKRLTEQGLEM